MKSFQLVTPAIFCLSILSVSASVQATDIVSPANVTGSNTALILNSTTQNWSIKSNGALSIERGGIIPILLDRNAGASAIFVDSDGDTALGTITPSNDFNSRLHIEDPTPDIAFKTPGANGQTWSLYANDVEFGLCDETAYPQNGGNVLCTLFSVEKGAPVDSLAIRNSGFVGVGTYDPEEKLHVVGPAATRLLVENTNAAASGDQVMFQLRNASPAKVRFAIGSNGGNVWTFDNTPSLDSFSISKVGTGLNEFLVKSNGDGTFRGRSFATQHINTSSRSVKTDFREIDVIGVLQRLADLPISEWRYKSENQSDRHIGPIAEDFKAAFGLGDGKTISTVDTSGIAFAAIQALYKELLEKNEKLEKQQAALNMQDKLLAQQMERLSQLESRLNEMQQRGSDEGLAYLSE